MADPQPTELSDAQREQLKQTLQTRLIDAKHLGYLAARSDDLRPQALVASMASVAAGDVSVCGAKTMLFEELREFELPAGGIRQVRCAAAAVLEMSDSPIHVHASTLEVYIVLSGEGKFILGAGANERVVDVQEGSVILLPPGQPHGIVSKDPAIPIRALLTFTPGLAPKEEPEFRDEEIVHARASDRLRELTDRPTNQST